MTDRLETLLRETYASDAAQAPLAGDLADGARHRATATRRRHAAITASALAVTATVVGAAVAFGPSTDRGTPEPGASTPAASSLPSASALFGDVEMGTLSLRDVSVPVPEDWLIGEASDCPVPDDSAYIFKPPAGAPCPAIPVPPNTFTTVRLALWPDPDTPAEDVTTRLEGGSTLVVRHLGDVVLRVISPDADLAQAIAASATVDGSQPTPLPDPSSDPAFDGVLSFGGVQVPVPADWLDPAHVRCGTAIDDAAWVAIGIVESCAARADHPERISSAVLEQMSSPPPSARPGESTLADGRTQIWSNIPGDAQLRLVVTSPDADLARQVFDGLVIVDRPDGCAMTMPVQPDANDGGTLAPDGMIHGQICSYVGSQAGAPVGFTHTLTDSEAQQLSAVLNAAPTDDRSRECEPTGSSPGDFDGWVVTLSGPEGEAATVVVATDACGLTSAASTTGARSRVTDELMSALHILAPSILGLPDVVSDK